MHHYQIQHSEHDQIGRYLIFLRWKILGTGCIQCEIIDLLRSAVSGLRRVTVRIQQWTKTRWLYRLNNLFLTKAPESVRYFVRAVIYCFVRWFVRLEPSKAVDLALVSLLKVIKIYLSPIKSISGVSSKTEHARLNHLNFKMCPNSNISGLKDPNSGFSLQTSSF